ncbi:MAG: DUF1778 domain-containing protein [Legionellales bacterium]|nr:DUF1778 domain-containing protein [Legionellales bacterium]
MTTHSQHSGYSAEKAARLEARLNPAQKEQFQHAADLTGQSLTDFVLNSIQEAANRVIREHQVINLTVSESERFVAALLDSPEPNPALKKAAQRYRKFKVDKD